MLGPVLDTLHGASYLCLPETMRQKLLQMRKHIHSYSIEIAYFVLGIVLDTLHGASYVSPRDYEAETTTDEETEVQRGEMTCLRA